MTKLFTHSRLAGTGVGWGGGQEPHCGSAGHLSICHMPFLLRTSLKVARGGVRPGRCQHHHGLIPAVGQVEGVELSQPRAWTLDPQSWERRVLGALWGIERLVVVASGNFSTLFCQVE